MKQITVNVYKFDELSSGAQHRASRNTIRVAQERARKENALDAVKGLLEAAGANEDELFKHAEDFYALTPYEEA